MDDKKLEMFFSKELWNETIDKAVSNKPWRSGHCLKHIKKSIQPAVRGAFTA